MRRTLEEAAQTRRTIIRAALREFSTKGWAGASLTSVARHAGLTRGAIYHHFDDKEALLRAVLSEEWSRQIAPALRALQDDTVPPHDRLLTFLSTYLRLLAEAEEFRDLAVTSTVVAPQAVDLTAGLDEKRQALVRWSEVLEPVLDACGPLRDGMTDTEALFVIFTFVHGLTLTAAVEPGLLPHGVSVDVISQAVVYGLLPAPASSH